VVIYNNKMNDLSTREGRQRFYVSKAWREVRKMQLYSEPLCEECFPDEIVPATVVDHKESLKHSPSKALILNNLTSLCKSCHSKKTASEMGWSKEPVGRIINRKWKIDVTKFKR